jgi:hypothetical protein
MFGQQHGGTSSPGEGGRIVRCIKFGREMPGHDRIPWKGELGMTAKHFKHSSGCSS